MSPEEYRRIVSTSALPRYETKPVGPQGSDLGERGVPVHPVVKAIPVFNSEKGNSHLDPAKQAQVESLNALITGDYSTPDTNQAASTIQPDIIDAAVETPRSIPSRIINLFPFRKRVQRPIVDTHS